MKVLFITEKMPYPLNTGGNIRTYHILKGLSREHDITLLTTIDHPGQEVHLHYLRYLCSKIIAINICRESLFQLAKKILKSMCVSAPIVVSRHCHPEVSLCLRDIFKIGNITSGNDHEFHIVHFNHLDTTGYMSYIPCSIIRILDEHNIVSNQVRTSAKADANILKRIYMRSQLKKTLRYESQAVQKMSLCFVCSEADKLHLEQVTDKTRAVVIPNGVDVEYFSGVPSNTVSGIDQYRKGRNLLFVGSLDYGPCETAVQYFAAEILPLIAAKVPDVRFIVVGRNPSARLQALANQNRSIVLTGLVPDIRPYAAISSVFVVPLLSGSGTRLKILDAMAMGIPVVSTSIGAEGLDVEHGANILLGDSPPDFGSAVIDLMENEVKAKAISNRARALVQEQYSWENIWPYLLAQYATTMPAELTRSY